MEFEKLFVFRLKPTRFRRYRSRWFVSRLPAGFIVSDWPINLLAKSGNRRITRYRYRLHNWELASDSGCDHGKMMLRRLFPVC